MNPLNSGKKYLGFRFVIFGFLISLSFLPNLLQAQEPGKFLTLNFNRQNNTTWVTMLDLDYQFEKDKYAFDAHFNHINIYNAARVDDPFIQLYFSSSIWQHYRLGEKLRMVSWFESDHYQKSENKKYNLYAGVEYRPLEYLSFSPMIGYSWDNRKANLDQGMSGALFYKIDKHTEKEVDIVSKGYLRYKNINPRQQINLSSTSEISKVFAENSRITLGIRGGYHELDDYSVNSVQRIISDSINPALIIGYELSPGLMWVSNNQITFSQRSFKYQALTSTVEFNDRSFTVMDVQSRQELRLNRDKWRVKAAYEYQFLNRYYDLANSKGEDLPVFELDLDREKTKDFQRGLHRAEFMVDLEILKRHHWETRYIGQYLQYDTPSEINFDDRDELSYFLTSAVRSTWNSRFRTVFGMTGNFRHFAFLLKEKSQDNYKQRFLRMDFSFVWRISNELTIKGDNAVYVTYNVKDFQDLNLTDRSTRNLETNYEILWKPIQNFESGLDFERKELQQSYLNWKEFTETTLDTTRFSLLSQTNRYIFKLKDRNVQMIAEAGYKHFNQTKRLKASLFDDQNALQPIFLRVINLQTGPFIGFMYRDQRQSFIQLKVWFQYQIRKFRWKPGEKLGGISSPYFIEDLRTTTVAMRPYITLNINYYFGG